MKTRRKRHGMTLEEFERSVENLKDYQVCLSCVHCLPIGGGDHICDAFNGCAPLVLDEYKPTSAYAGCRGKMWERR